MYVYMQVVKLIEGHKYYVVHKLKENDLVTRLAIMPKVILPFIMYAWQLDDDGVSIVLG